MNAEGVRKRVERIDRISDQDESAHAAEDALYLSVLRAIAKGADDPAGLAREAIKAAKITFSRWYA